MKKWVIATICLIPIGAYLAVYPIIETPLYKTSSVRIEVYTRDGGLQESIAYAAFRMPDRTYIHIPSLSNSVYQWFVIDWKYNLVGASARPYNRLPGLLTVNKGSGAGIGLLTPKIEDTWSVHTNINIMAFSNAWLSVTVTRN